MYKPSWKIATAPDLEALETLVNKIQGEGYIIEDINTTSLVVVYYKYNEEKEKELLEVESQLKRGREDAAMFSHGNVEISRRGAT